MTAADTVAARAHSKLDDAIAALSDYLRFPAISCDASHHDDVRRLAARIRDDLEAWAALKTASTTG